MLEPAAGHEPDAVWLERVDLKENTGRKIVKSARKRSLGFKRVREAYSKK